MREGERASSAARGRWSSRAKLISVNEKAGESEK